MKKENFKNYLYGLLIGCIFLIPTIIYAASITATSFTYIPKNKIYESANVGEAINELYNQVNKPTCLLKPEIIQSNCIYNINYDEEVSLKCDNTTINFSNLYTEKKYKIDNGDYQDYTSSLSNIKANTITAVGITSEGKKIFG